MSKVIVQFNSIEEVQKFVNDISKLDGFFDLTSGRYYVDAKSILGVCSLGLRKELMLQINSDEDQNKVMQAVKPFVA